MQNKISCDDFLKNKTLTNLRLNKSKTAAAYFINIPELSTNKYNKSIEILDLKELKISALEIDIEPDDFDFFDDDLYILKYVGASTLIYRYEFLKNKLVLYEEIPFQIGKIYINKSTIYFTSIITDDKSLETSVCGTELPFSREGMSYSNNSRRTLFKFDICSRKLSRLSALNFHIDDIVFDLENNIIIFTAYIIKNMQPVTSDVYSYDTESKIIKKWTDGNYRVSFVEILFSQKIVFIGLNTNEKNRNDNQDIYIIDMVDGNIRLLGEPLDISNEFPGITSDSRSTTLRPVLVDKKDFYFLSSDRFEEKLNKIDKNGNLFTYDIKLKVIDDFAVVEDKVLLIGLSEQDLHELYIYDGQELIKISEYNNWFYKKRQMSIPKYYGINMEDVVIDGWVIFPSNFNPKDKYPGVLMIHGGPKSSFTNVYEHTMQVLAANGYFVFYANPQGSDGRGDEFLDIRGQFASIAYDQLMYFVDKVLETHPQIDKNSLGVIGHSYGGYLTNYIITKTNKFKAAISESGISNLVTAFTSSDIGYQYVYEYMGSKTPWCNLTQYIESSPINMANMTSTPTLFIHGTEDKRCNYTESLNMYTALNYHGVKTKLCLLDGEGHTIAVNGKPKSKTIRYQEILKWFDEILIGE